MRHSSIGGAPEVIYAGPAAIRHRFFCLVLLSSIVRLTSPLTPVVIVVLAVAHEAGRLGSRSASRAWHVGDGDGRRSGWGRSRRRRRRRRAGRQAQWGNWGAAFLLGQAVHHPQRATIVGAHQLESGTVCSSANGVFNICRPWCDLRRESCGWLY